MSIQEKATSAKATTSKATILSFADAETTVNSIADQLTKDIYAFLKANTDNVRSVKSTAIRDAMQKLHANITLRRQIRDKTRYLVDLRLVRELKTLKGRKQVIFLYNVVKRE
jgi:gamma-glutamyl phosphate reductase